MICGFSSEATSPSIIIDGQQRLVTIIILIRVIIDKLEEGGKINFITQKNLRDNISVCEIKANLSFVLNICINRAFKVFVCSLFKEKGIKKWQKR